jgi:hypothetical protein
MKKLIKKITPDILKPLLYSDFFLRISRKKYRNTIKDKSPAEVFNYIYQNNVWGDHESISGSGSNMHQTKQLVALLSEVLKKVEVKRFLDLPCGDFNWMQKVDLTGINYTGGDIVESIVAENNKKFKSVGRNFEVLNIITDQLPPSDLLLCRDCFVHLSNEKVMEALANIKKQNIKYLLTTSFPATKQNKDILTGEWRPLNLELPPYNLKPIAIFNEGCTENEERDFSDKSLILVQIQGD